MPGCDGGARALGIAPTWGAQGPARASAVLCAHDRVRAQEGPKYLYLPRGQAEQSDMFRNRALANSAYVPAGHSWQ